MHSANGFGLETRVGPFTTVKIPREPRGILSAVAIEGFQELGVALEKAKKRAKGDASIEGFVPYGTFVLRNALLGISFTGEKPIFEE
jgi:hypothetical protein